MRPLVWILAAPRVTRQTTDLPPGPLLIIANHVTAYDGALILYALPAKLRRNVAVAMSGEMLLDLRHGRNQGNIFLNLLAPAATGSSPPSSTSSPCPASAASAAASHTPAKPWTAATPS